MARGRMLNNSISRSLKFDLLPDDTCRLLATWVIPHLDVRGVFYGDPAIVQSLVFTRRRDVTAEQVDEYLRAMEAVGLIILFEAEGQRWQQWPGFSANQVGLRTEREKTDLPPPPGYMPPNAAEEPPNDGKEPPDDGEETDASRQDTVEESAEGESQVQVQIESQVKSNDSPPTAAPTAKPPPAPSSTSPSKPRNPRVSYTAGQRGFLDLFGGKRFKTKIQRDAVLQMEQEFGTELLLEAARWAAKRGMGVGAAVVSLETALPKWGKRKTPKSTQPHGGILTWLESKGVKVDDDGTD